MTTANIQDIAPVPLFVKYPNQTKGKVDRRWVKTIDLLPTIADTLGIKMPFKVDGRSLRDESYTGLPDVQMEQSDGDRVKMPIGEFEARKKGSLDRRLTLFGAGAWKPVYDLGPRPDLIGRGVGGAAALPGAKASIQFADRFDDVQPSAGVVPGQVRGTISGDLPAGTPLAFALNGRVVSTATSFKPVGRFHVEFASLLPADGFKAGRNRLEVLAVKGDELQRIGAA